jgi:Fe-S oxidoreductase
MAQMAANGQTPDVLFWVGCAGSFDQRAQKITKAFVKILHHFGISYAVLGGEEMCTGDPARRAGNEMVFQMMAQQNIATLNGYGVKKIVTACPHCFNTLKNEYPDLGGVYEVLHHTQFLQQMIDTGRIQLREGGVFKGKKITFHDPCYLARANGEYQAPRALLERLDAELIEMENSRQRGMCCGAGGAQIFKESEKGDMEVHHKRADEALGTGAHIIAASCPFCTLMITDGIKHREKEAQVKVMDVAELIAQAEDL